MMRWMMMVMAGVAGMVMMAGAVRGDVTISAAVSLRGVLADARPLLEKAAGEKVAFNFGASGTLAGQVRQGAPVDVFIAADRATVEKLVEAKACDKETMKVVAGNAMVLVVPAKGDGVVTGFADLMKAGKVAVGEPKVVPAGVYAKEVLEKLKLWEGLEKAGKLVMGENAAAVLAYVARGEVDAGLVYATDAKGSKEVKVVATAEEKWHEPIEYVGAIVSGTKKRAGAEAVMKELSSEGVRKILGEAGFVVGEKSEASSQKLGGK